MTRKTKKASKAKATKRVPLRTIVERIQNDVAELDSRVNTLNALSSFRIATLEFPGIAGVGQKRVRG